jgi:hypothetical protein
VQEDRRQNSYGKTVTFAVMGCKSCPKGARQGRIHFLRLVCCFGRTLTLRISDDTPQATKATKLFPLSLADQLSRPRNTAQILPQMASLGLVLDVVA